MLESQCRTSEILRLSWAPAEQKHGSKVRLLSKLMHSTLLMKMLLLRLYFSSIESDRLLRSLSLFRNQDTGFLHFILSLSGNRHSSCRPFRQLLEQIAESSNHFFLWTVQMRRSEKIRHVSFPVSWQARRDSKIHASFKEQRARNSINHCECFKRTIILR
jgi:hypothetical protein